MCVKGVGVGKKSINYRRTLFPPLLSRPIISAGARIVQIVRIVRTVQIGMINVGYFLGYLFSILGDFIADIAVIE